MLGRMRHVMNLASDGEPLNLNLANRSFLLSKLVLWDGLLFEFDIGDDMGSSDWLKRASHVDASLFSMVQDQAPRR